MGKQEIVQWLDNKADLFVDMAKQIWDRPEVAYTETFASSLQKKALEEAGFTISSDVGGVPTAFVAEFGKGKPMIGVLGEFDALPGLSQHVSANRSSIVENGPGHGCGHHLLGTAGVAAVIALKESMVAQGLNGTIRYYGCPAEEVVSGKSFMARAGVFDDLDCAVSWHPDTVNRTNNKRSLALTSIEFQFKGIAAHAGLSPHLGRSALDAVELMNVGANYLREHVLDGSRIHYVITNGGLAPNIVPEEASVLYFLRGANRDHVDDLLARLLKIANGAAMMTETEVTWDIKAQCYDTLPNETMINLMYEQFAFAGTLEFSEEDYRFAKELVASLDPHAASLAERRMKEMGVEEDNLLPTGFYNHTASFGINSSGSTDVGDVSYIIPVGQVGTTCAPIGTAYHTWQATAAFGSPIGMKGMVYASKIMALSVYDLLLNKDDVIDKAKEEFAQRTQGKPYVCGIPEYVKPPVSSPVPVPAG